MKWYVNVGTFMVGLFGQPHNSQNLWFMTGTPTRSTLILYKPTCELPAISRSLSIFVDRSLQEDQKKD